MYNSNIESFVSYRTRNSSRNSYPTWFHQESIDKYLGLWPADALKQKNEVDFMVVDESGKGMPLSKTMKYSTEKEDEISCSDYMNAIGCNRQVQL